MAKGLLIEFLLMFIVAMLFVVFPLLVMFHVVLDLLVDFNISSSKYTLFATTMTVDKTLQYFS